MTELHKSPAAGYRAGVTAVISPPPATGFTTSRWSGFCAWAAEYSAAAFLTLAFVILIFMPGQIVLFDSCADSLFTCMPGRTVLHLPGRRSACRPGRLAACLDGQCLPCLPASARAEEINDRCRGRDRGRARDRDADGDANGNADADGNANGDGGGGGGGDTGRARWDPARHHLPPGFLGVASSARTLCCASGVVCFI